MLNVRSVGGYESIRFFLPDGDPGVEQTIELIRQLVDEGLTDPRVRRVATEIVRNAGVAPYSELGEVHAVFEWVRNPRNIRFFKDMVGKEMLQPAWSVLESGAGDCDCINAIVLPSLLGAIGYATRAVTVAADDSDPGNFSHIYIEALVSESAGGYWVPLDVARPGAAWLRTPEQYTRIKRWPLMDAANIPEGALPVMSNGYLNGLRAVQPGVQPIFYKAKRLMPRFGMGQDDSGFTDADVQAFTNVPESGPNLYPTDGSLLPGTVPPTTAPVYVSSTPGGTISQTPSGGSWLQKLVPILATAPPILQSVAPIVASAKGTTSPSGTPATGYPAGTAVATLSAGGSSILGLLLVVGLGFLGIRALSK
jgi:hypothetical protein